MSKTANHPNKTNGTAHENEQTQPLPLFFKKPHVITDERHANARIRNGLSMDFARATNFIPLTAADIPEAAKFYPLAFTLHESVVPIAIVGFEGNNLFIQPDGEWASGVYVPSYVRRYPFIFLEIPDNDQLTLCVDEEVLTDDPKEGKLALYEGGKPSSYTQNALEFCAAYHEQYKLTQLFCETVQKHELLTPQQSKIKLDNGKEFTLEGFQLIHADKFKSLTQEQAYDLYRQGVLAMAYYIFQSQTNWKNLLDRAAGSAKASAF